MMVNEDWKSVSGYEGLYEVSSLGRMRSLDKIVATRWGGTTVRPGKILSPTTHRSGHKRIGLTRDGVTRLHFVHRLAALAFLPNPEDLPIVRHWNDIPGDNQVGNLRWGTVSDNWNDMVRNGNHHHARKTHCPRNHEYTEENTRRDSMNRRFCRECGREKRAEMALEVGSDPNHRLHGTPSGYAYGCRCGACSDVKARNRGTGRT